VNLSPNPAMKGARHLLRLAVLVALLPLLLIALGSIGTRLGWWDWKVGFGKMSVGWASAWAWIGLFGGLVAAYVAAFAGFRRLWPYALVSLLIPVVVLAGFNGLRARARAVPAPIHDVATDWNDPLMFSEQVLRLRGPDANPVERDPTAKWYEPPPENWAIRRVADFNRIYCADAKPARIAAPPAEAHARARRAAETAGLEVLTDDPATGRLEAVATSRMYGFRDDVVFRVRAEGAGSRVDVRSISRVGGSDLGANCRRVTGLLRGLAG
jgi:fatty-acyl-CoA synthase